MRRARITFEGAFHLVSTSGIDGENIFSTVKNKKTFLNLLYQKSQKHRIRIFGLLSDGQPV